MMELRHPTLVEAFGLHLERLPRGRCEISILMEYCEGGDVHTLLHGDPARSVEAQHPLGEARVLSLLAQTIVSLDFIHASGLAHRDIKPANLLLSADGRWVKLADLGLARDIDSASASRGAGTIAYMSPEAFGDRPAPAMDVFSLGVMAVELSSAHRPEMNLRSQADVEALLAHVPPNFSAAFRELVGGMLAIEPERRPSAAAMLRRPLIVPHVLALHEAAGDEASSTRDDDDLSIIMLSSSHSRPFFMPCARRRRHTSRPRCSSCSSS